jgi:RND family efflux transporter MFP subunit
MSRKYIRIAMKQPSMMTQPSIIRRKRGPISRRSAGISFGGYLSGIRHDRSAPARSTWRRGDLFRHHESPHGDVFLDTLVYGRRVMNEINHNVEEQLRATVHDLRRQLDERRRGPHPSGRSGRGRPSVGRLTFLALLLLALIVGGFFAGYLPRQWREELLARESRDAAGSLRSVTVAKVTRAENRRHLVLPGNLQAVIEAPILARASGYIKTLHVDIGDRVKTGQVLAEIEAPELDQQITQAAAMVEQAKNSVARAEATLQGARGAANQARVTAERWGSMQKAGVVSRQENDTYQADYASREANVQALAKSVTAFTSGIGAAEADLARLQQLKTYQTVRAAFDGVITLRNVDPGALVNQGSTLLFRMAQTFAMRANVNVPQSDADSVRVGQEATTTIAERPGQKFPGTVARTANSLDPASRTLLAEIQLGNSSGLLMPGMSVQVDLAIPQGNPPLVIPGDTLVMRSDGPRVVVVQPGGTVHYARIQLGRDLGDKVEVLTGLKEGQDLVVNPSATIADGAQVRVTGGKE